MPVLGSSSSSGSGSVWLLFRGRKEKFTLRSANSPLREILEEACTKWNVPSDKFRLKHRGKVVDLSLPFRLSGIGNNSTIEVDGVQGNSQEENSIRVQIRFETSGQQAQGRVADTTTLLQLLNQLAGEIGETPDQVSCLIHMRQRIERSEFNTKTLADLGIRHGSVAFHAKNNQSLEQDQSTLNNTTTNESSGQDTSSQTESALETKVAPPLSPVAKMNPLPRKEISLEECVSAVNKIQQTYFDEDSRVIVKTLLKIVTAILSRPQDEKVRQLKLSNANFYDRVGRFEAAVSVLSAIGFELSPDRVYVLRPQVESTKILQGTANALADLAVKVGIPPDQVDTIMRTAAERMQANQSTEKSKADPVVPVEPFDPFKSNVVRVAPQPRGGESAIDRELRVLQERHERMIKEAGIPTRRTRIIVGEEATSSKFNPRQFSLAEKPQASNETAKSDMQVLLEATKARMAKQKESEQFRTKAMRDLEALKKARIFTSTLIRILFPDRNVIQAYFSPSEPLSAVIAELNGLLVESCQSQFELYTTPPMQVLSPSKSLKDQGLLPAALVHLRWQVDPEKNGYLTDAAKEQAASSSQTEAMEIDEVFPSAKPVAPEYHPKHSSSSTSSSSSSTSTSEGRTSKPGGKRPKWFKL